MSLVHDKSATLVYWLAKIGLTYKTAFTFVRASYIRVPALPGIGKTSNGMANV